MTTDPGSERPRPQDGFRSYFDWHHYLLGNNLAAATLQLLAGTAAASVIFAVIWTCFVD